MSKNTWDAVLASSPLNVTAGRVVSRGEHYEPEEMKTGHCWDERPDILPPTDPIFAQPQFINLTGHVLGRLTVLGVFAEDGNRGQKRTNGSLWVCRCVCGRYQGIRGKTIKRQGRDRCDHCDHTRRLQLFASGSNARERASDTAKRRWTLP